MGRRQQRVLDRLTKALSAAEQGRGDGWVCARTLMHPEVGGNRWNARLHELIDAGVRVEKKAACDCGQCRHSARRARQRGEQPTRLTAWRLVSREEMPV